MDPLAEKLDGKLKEWRPEAATEAKQRITELIDMADSDLLDLGRSRAVEQADSAPSNKPIARRRTRST